MRLPQLKQKQKQNQRIRRMVEPYLLNVAEINATEKCVRYNARTEKLFQDSKVVKGFILIWVNGCVKEEGETVTYPFTSDHARCRAFRKC